MKKIIFMVLFLGIGPFMVWDSSDIIDDYKLRSENLVVADILTNNRKCSSTAFLFHQCSFDYTLNENKIRESYRFLAFGSPEKVQVLRGEHSGKLTSTVAQLYFWNRIITVIFCMLISLLTLKALLKGSSAGRNNRTKSRVDLGNSIDMNQTVKSSATAQNSPIFGKR